MVNGKQSGIKVDIIVVGAGPAGCAAAIWGAYKGLKIALIEGRTSPNEKPGESFHPGIFSIFRLLGIEDDIKNAEFLHYAGQFVNWGKTSEYQEFGTDANGPHLGIHAPRDKFESILLKRAIALGVDVKQPCKATSILCINERIVGVETSEGSIMGQIVVDATGSRQWLAKQKKISINSLSQKLIAFYGYTGTDSLETEKRTFLEADNSGWTWIARIDSNRFAWTFIPFNNPKQKVRCPIKLKNSKTISATKGADVTWRTTSKTAGLGFFIVGDAAATFDPLSSDGVLRALITGIKAADLSYSIVKNQDQEIQLINYYRNWCEELFNSELEKLKLLYKELLENNYIKIFTD